MPAPPEDLSVTQRHDIYPGIDPKPHYASQSYQGKVVFITGPSRGIGEEIALTYARAGASLALVARNQGTLDAVKAAILREAPKAAVLTCVADVVNTKEVEAAVKATVDKFGKLDILIANAGKADPWDKPFTQKDPDNWWNTIEINLRGVYNVAHFALPHLDKTKGYSILISSGAAQQRIPFGSNYTVSKHAVGRFNEFIVIEHPNVKSFALHPGSIKTDMALLNPAFEHYMTDSTRLPAATALRLTSGRDDYLSGRYVSANWDFDEVATKYKAKILEDEALVSRLAVPVL